MMADIPDGFRAMKSADGFIGHNGPYYWRKGEDGRTEFGFASDQRHVNPNGVLHGGAVLGFLDTILGDAVFREVRRPCATIAFDSRFLAAAKPGAWITGRVTIRRITRTLAFVDGEALAGETVLVTASGVFRVFDA